MASAWRLRDHAEMAAAAALAVARRSRLAARSGASQHVAQGSGVVVFGLPGTQQDALLHHALGGDPQRLPPLRPARGVGALWVSGVGGDVRVRHVQLRTCPRAVRAGGGSPLTLTLRRRRCSTRPGGHMGTSISTNRHLLLK